MTTDAREFVRGDTERVLEEWLRIAAIPAPLGGESARAELIAELAAAAGAESVGIDRTGNVIATVDGDDADGETLTVLGTMDDLDTIAALRAAGTPLFRQGDRMVGAATETTSSDASGLSMLRFVKQGGLPFRQLRFAWVVGEETGLTGVRGLVDDLGADLGLVLDLMGGVGTVSWNGLGFGGVEVEFACESRHSLDGGASEVSDAIARFVTALHARTMPFNRPLAESEPTVRRVNRIHAGEVFNHSPRTGVVGVDIRSTDPDVLAELVADTQYLAESAARDAGVQVTVTPGEQQPAVRLPGGAEHRMVRALADGVRYAGHEPVLRPWSSSNINVVYAAGLEGVVHDGLHRGEGRGSAEEWTSIPSVLDGIVADCRMLQLLGATFPRP